MKKIMLIGMIGLVYCFSGIRISGAQAPEAREPILVGRIAYLEGQLLRYVPSEQDWVATVQDAPFGLEDALFSDRNGRAELILPNNTWIRISRGPFINPGLWSQKRLRPSLPDRDRLKLNSPVIREGRSREGEKQPG